MTSTHRQHIYREHGDKPPGTRRYLWQPILRRLDAMAEGTAVLDAGCGNGWFAKALVDQGFEVFGIDLEETGIDHARRLLPDCRFERASVYDDLQVLFERQFDAVVSLEVIEHLYDPELFVKRVHESLRPGGAFICTTPYHGWLKNTLVAISGKHDRHYNPLQAGGHIKFWSFKTLQTLLEKAGFQILHREGAGRLPYMWKSMILAARR